MVVNGTEMESRVRAYFALFGFHEDPEEISQIVGIAPSRTQRAGEPISIARDHPSLFRDAAPLVKVNSWVLDSGLDPSADVASHVRALLDHLEPVRDVLARLAERYDAVFNCIVESYGGDRPAICFDNDIVKAVGQYNAALDVDLYVFP